MISKLIGALFTPRYPKGYTGRHRAEFALARATRPAKTLVGAVNGRHVTI
jgi:hypothetical protein